MKEVDRRAVMLEAPDSPPCDICDLYSETPVSMEELSSAISQEDLKI